MNYADAVRAKHKLDAKVRELLKLAAIASNEELELAIAHVADDLQSPTPRSADGSGRFKGKLLTAYWDGRRSGTLKQQKFMRPLMRGQRKEYFRERGLLMYQHILEAYAEKKRTRDIAARKSQKEYEKLFESWKEGRRALPFWRRVFSRRDPPRPPALPALVKPPPRPEEITRREIHQGTMADFVVGAIRDFRFQAEDIPDDIPDFSIQELRALSDER